jgi:hypothetical protein
VADEIEARMVELWDARQRELLGYGRGEPFAEAVDLFVAYADELQREGDPRGSLIAWDLLPRVRDAEPDKQEVLCRWLGTELASDPAIESRCGLLSVHLDGDRGDEVLDKIGRTVGVQFIEAVHVKARFRAIDRLLRTLSERVHPWLGCLSIALDGDSGTRDRPVISDDLLQDLVRATPRLYSAQLEGPRLMRSFPHPGLMKLSCHGAYAIAHPSARMDLGPCRAWFHPADYLDVRITLPDDAVFCVDATEASFYLERVYDDLPAEVAEAWDGFWQAVRRVEPLPMTRLSRVLESSLGALQSDGWMRLARRVMESTYAGDVRVESVPATRQGSPPP